MPIIFVRTRTGTKIHLSHVGTSACYCGHWLKTSSVNRKVSPDRVKPENICERCCDPSNRDVMIGRVKQGEEFIPAPQDKGTED